MSREAINLYNPSNVSVSTVITDYDWADDSRPILTIDESCKGVHVQVGDVDRAPYFGVSASSIEDLAGDLEGWSEIFKRAAEFLRSKVDA